MLQVFNLPLKEEKYSNNDGQENNDVKSSIGQRETNELE
jgi:hypothetical protein